MRDRYGQLALAALRGSPLRIPDGIDPERLYKRVCEHGLAGLIVDVQRRVPVLPELADRLRAVAAAHEAAVQQHLVAARDLAAALRKHDVPAVFVKGVALALTVYPRPGLRSFGDLDLLVRPDSVPAAERALADVGFLPEPDPLPSSMESSFVRPGPLPVGVDLHWRFTENDRLQAAVRIPVEEILGRRRDVDAIPIPTAEDNLLLAAANLVRSRVDRMVLLMDFARLAASGPDWSAVTRRARDWGLRTALWLGLRLSRELFDGAAPASVLDELAPPGWRRRWIDGLLSGSALWSRRKVRHRVVAYGLPLLCADSWTDLATTIGASRARLLGTLGWSAPRGG